jgi:Uma2 family endonuclease
MMKTNDKNATIDVECVAKDDTLRFLVMVREGPGASRHEVTAARDMLRQLSRDEAPAKDVVEAAFRFLLDREPKESILSRFDMSVISRYFPEFERELPNYLRRRRSLD